MDLKTFPLNMQGPINIFHHKIKPSFVSGFTDFFFIFHSMKGFYLGAVIFPADLIDNYCRVINPALSFRLLL
jgi:hypothetical protein